jgi:hypothetical protein
MEKTIKISETLHKELKIYCVENSLKLNKFINDILDEKLKNLNAKKINK